MVWRQTGWLGARPPSSSELFDALRGISAAQRLELMAVAVRPEERVEVDDRPLLPLPLTTILIVELAVLATLVAAFGTHPPFARELGWASAASMIVMQLYSLRRRVHALRNFGALRTWLDTHIFLGFQAYIFVAYHSASITAHASLAAVDFALVTIVVVTGVLGRYLYSFIPRARAGRTLTYEQLESALGATALPSTLRRECRGLIDLVGLDVARRRALRELERDPAATPGRTRMLRRSITLASWISTLEVADHWFSRWTLLHRPLSVLLFGITTLHVLAHYAYAT